jgi:hypothetical protein
VSRTPGRGRGSRDPYLAAEALHSLITIEGVEQLRPWLQELAERAPFMVSGVAARSSAPTDRGYAIAAH